MQRRDLLKLGGWTALAAIGGAWALTRELAGPGAPLSLALERARSVGKPVLVLVAPPAPEGFAELGVAFADALEFGGDDLLLDLLLCETTCATPYQLAEALDVHAAPNEVGLLEFDGTAWTWRRIDFDTTVDYRFASEAEYDERDARWVAALRAALAGDVEMLSRRAAESRNALGAERIAELEVRLASGASLDEPSIVSAAAWLRSRPESAAMRSATIAAARASAWDRPPSGGRWAQSDCGSVVVTSLPSDDAGVRYDLERRAKGESPAFRLWPGRPIPNPFRRLVPAGAFACGMAFSSRRANRFLFFYVDQL